MSVGGSNGDGIALGDIPLGHDICAHVVHGWCYSCAGRTITEEAYAWRVWSMTNVPDVAEALRRYWGDRESGPGGGDGRA